MKSVVEFAQKAMGTKDVRLDPKLNQAIWAQGIKNVPHRMRLKLEREFSLLNMGLRTRFNRYSAGYREEK